GRGVGSGGGRDRRLCGGEGRNHAPRDDREGGNEDRGRDEAGMRAACGGNRGHQRERYATGTHAICRLGNGYRFWLLQCEIRTSAEGMKNRCLRTFDGSTNPRNWILPFPLLRTPAWSRAAAARGTGAAGGCCRG